MAAEAADLHLATIRDKGIPMPPARSLEAVRADQEWADGRGLD
jgi:hypothetical protein